jgi:hypothetical protein
MIQNSIKQKGKKGIILLATLGIVTGIIFLIAQSLKLMDTALEDSKKFQKFNQTAILKNDLNKIIPKILENIKNPQDFEKITYIPFVFEESESNIKIILTIKPNTALNINDTSADVRNVFSEILKKYKIKDEPLFLALLSDRSEIAQSDKSFKKERFDNLAQWNKFIQYYASQAEDGEALNIPWDEIVEFDGLKIDATALEGNIALDGVEIPQSLKASYTPQNHQFICEVEYSYNLIKDQFRFVYKK